ncbi:helix-turn-helix domain-containing protein [Bacillus sp. AFS014408]|uniref:helix-turn-helix domain-containing protein n=1 Tax=Bacillus sp. AFS014408 TaxID=2034278 RepID=UPI0020D22467|nr:helix-turn-helix transcriptional regulator [Bacillus sp. AFS014408]
MNKQVASSKPLVYNRINKQDEGDKMMVLDTEKVKALRTQLGFSQSYVAKHIGYSNKSIYCNLELGNRQPSITKLVLLAKLLDVKTEEILKESI